MKTLDVLMPVVESDGTLVVLVVGSAAAQFGDEVTLIERGPEERVTESLYVAAVDTVGLLSLSADVLALFGCASVEDLYAKFERYYGSRPPLNLRVTLFTLFDHPIEDLEWEEIEDGV